MEPTGILLERTYFGVGSGSGWYWVTSCSLVQSIFYSVITNLKLHLITWFVDLLWMNSRTTNVDRPVDDPICRLWLKQGTYDRHIVINLPLGMTAEQEVQAFSEVQEHGPQKVTEFLGPWNGISCIFRATLPSSDLVKIQVLHVKFINYNQY